MTVHTEKEPTMSDSNIGTTASEPRDRRPAIRRLLFVADAAVADVAELPPAVSAVIDAAAEVYVLTPALPGRLEWLADDTDRFQHVADERLDVVLGHIRSIGAHASGLASTGSVMTVIGDAVSEFTPDHLLLALRTSEHANWQERRLIEHIEERFGLPVISYGVDHEGHASTAAGPLLLCYDGSDDAVQAIEQAGTLFTGWAAVVVTAWQPAAGLASTVWSGETPGTEYVAGLDRAAAEEAERIAAEGARVALQAGLKAEPLAVEAAGSVSKTILRLADQNDAATIVMGSRGLTGLRSMLLGSVSQGVAHHSDRPTLIIRHPRARTQML
jgi:nucleotide-binding universal stress UspA family protein